MTRIIEKPFTIIRHVLPAGPRVDTLVGLVHVDMVTVQRQGERIEITTPDDNVVFAPKTAERVRDALTDLLDNYHPAATA